MEAKEVDKEVVDEANKANEANEQNEVVDEVNKANEANEQNNEEKNKKKIFNKNAFEGINSLEKQRVIEENKIEDIDKNIILRNSIEIIDIPENKNNKSVEEQQIRKKRSLKNNHSFHKLPRLSRKNTIKREIKKEELKTKKKPKKSIKKVENKKKKSPKTIKNDFMFHKLPFKSLRNTVKRITKKISNKVKFGRKSKKIVNNNKK